MNRSVNTIIFPVTDVARAKALFARLLGAEPYADQAYYVGFKVGGQDIGLDPKGHQQGMTGPVAYFEVDDVDGILKGLVEAGAEKVQGVRDVGGGKLIATVKDADGNMIGLMHTP